MTETFESSVNSYGRKTKKEFEAWLMKFESSVNSYGRKTLEKLWVIDIMFESSVAVSYTHLDVYKRQILSHMEI